jgi:hypothetical protein
VWQQHLLRRKHAMFETEIKINRFLLQYCRMLTADIPDERFAEQPLPGVNHPAWIVGHLALSTDFANALLGGEKAFSVKWGGLSGRGSKPSSSRSEYPTKDELLQAVETGFQRACEMAATASAVDLARPNPNAIIREGLPTAGDALAFVLTGHLAAHLGQLSAWRRMIGMPPMF